MKTRRRLRHYITLHDLETARERGVAEQPLRRVGRFAFDRPDQGFLRIGEFNLGLGERRAMSRRNRAMQDFDCQRIMEALAETPGEMIQRRRRNLIDQRGK
jgi:hypothetical protein